eukprot:5530584-Amphidinium_carterae.1
MRDRIPRTYNSHFCLDFDIRGAKACYTVQGKIAVSAPACRYALKLWRFLPWGPTQIQQVSKGGRSEGDGPKDLPGFGTYMTFLFSALTFWDLPIRHLHLRK